MYIHVQLVLTGNTSYILLLTEPLIIIWGIMTFSFQFNETSFAKIIIRILHCIFYVTYFICCLFLFTWLWVTRQRSHAVYIMIDLLNQFFTHDGQIIAY